MTTFTVEWTIEIEAESPEDAARKALLRMGEHERARAANFHVYCDDADEGDGYRHHEISIEAEGWAQRLKAPRPVTLSDWQAELDIHFPSDRQIAEDAGLA